MTKKTTKKKITKKPVSRKKTSVSKNKTSCSTKDSGSSCCSGVKNFFKKLFS